MNSRWLWRTDLLGSRSSGVLRKSRTLAPRNDDHRTRARLVSRRLALWAFALTVFTCGIAHGQLPAGASARGIAGGPDMADVGIDQKLGAQVPGDLVFSDESGQPVRFEQLEHGRPILFTLVYYQCPMLCTMVLDDLTRTLNSMHQNVGENFDVIVVSIDPHDTPQVATQTKLRYLRGYRRPGAEANWHFLTGSQQSISAIADAVGFRYKWDPKFKNFAHASGLLVLTPTGKVSRYFYGVDYAANDIRFATDEASGGTIGSPAEKVLLYCFQYDPTTGRYGLAIWRVLQLLGLVSLVMLCGFVALSLRREKRHGGPGVDAMTSGPGTGRTHAGLSSR